MSNIFTFRPGKKDLPNGDFLDDADDMVEFVATDDEVELCDTLKYVLRTPLPETGLQDWSNQELADIYRVKKLLDAAGVPNTLERGISDEGDPWCVFCSLEGEVFIHLSRIGGRFVVDSPNLRSPLYGADFADLIAEFSAGALQSTPELQKDGRRVVKIPRNGKVFLHPSALLAALIWSIYLNSEDLVMFAPDEDDLGEGDAFDAIVAVNDMASAQFTDAEIAAFLQTDAISDQVLGVRRADLEDAESDDVRDGTMFKDIASKTALVFTPNPIAIGLSSIAIAAGIMSEGLFDNSIREVAVPAEAPLPKRLETEASLPPEREPDTTVRPAQFDITAVLQSMFDHHAPEASAAEPSALSINLAGGLDLASLLSSILSPPHAVDIEFDVADVFQEEWSPAPLGMLRQAKENTGKEESPAGETAEIVSASAVVTEPESADIGVHFPNPTSELTSLLDFKASIDGSFETFNVSGEVVEATFDLALLETSVSPWLDPLFSDTSISPNPLTEPDTIDLTVDAEVPDDSSLFRTIDQNAQSFIEYLMSRPTGVEVISRPTELVILDFEAINSEVKTDSMEWVLEDGNTIHVVGAISDFVEYNLVA